jgi:glycosyltransferase involved in cell wall biosynthesis
MQKLSCSFPFKANHLRAQNQLRRRPGKSCLCARKYYENLRLGGQASARKVFFGFCEQVTGTEPLRILALLEAASISGTAKAVLEMAYEARADFSGRRPLEISIANFIRGGQPEDNVLTRTLDKAQFPFAFIREKGRFDRSVIPQIRSLAKNANVVWTNSIKSHFLVYRASLGRTFNWVAFHHGYTSTDLKMRLYNELDRVSLRHASRVLTVCLPFAEQMKARGVPASRIRVQHMPIRRFRLSPDDAAELRADLRLLPEARVILSVGRLSHEKGHRDLIAAFAALRDQMKDAELRLVLVGDGPERARLQQQARECDAQDQIVFAGHRDDAKRFYALASVFALPSYSEGTPNVLLEAMAAGVPVVATRVGGIPELATDGTNALLVPPSNPSAMADALQKVLQSAILRNELTSAAAEVVESHSPRAYFESMRQVFLEAAT